MSNLKLVIFLCIIFVDCSSLKNYSKNRLNDAVDIFNIGFEDKSIGTKINFGSLFGFGAWFSGTENGYGLRFGHFGKYKFCSKESTYTEPENKKSVHENELASCFIFHCSNIHQPLEGIENRNIKKTIFIFQPLRLRKYWGIRSYYLNGPLRLVETNNSYTDYYIEGTISLYYGIRLGFNPHELLDFIVGIFGFDMLDDDTVTVYRELPVPIEQNQVWEKKLEEVDTEFEMRVK